MRRSRHTLIALSFVLALLVPALALAVEQQQTPVDAEPPQLTAGNVRPNAALAVSVDGTSVTFDASGSSDSDGTLTLFEWDLDGDGAFEEKSGAQSLIERELPGGTTLIAAVRVRDDGGAAHEATASVSVPVVEEEAPGPAAVATSDQQLVDPSQLETGDGTAAAAPAAAPDPDPDPEPAAKPRKRRQRSTSAAGDPRIRAAASRSVTISDFEFTPATVNIDVGDSVTWTNRGPTVHTATASDGSFDSGTLDRGQRYSKTFSSAGTYQYICTPHPFMRGRVVVGGAGDDSGGGSGGGDSGSGSDGGGGSGGDDDAAGTGSSGGGDSSAGGLANTGVDLIAWSVFGFSLLAFGAAMRLRLSVD